MFLSLLQCVSIIVQCVSIIVQCVSIIVQCVSIIGTVCFYHWYSVFLSLYSVFLSLVQCVSIVLNDIYRMFGMLACVMCFFFYLQSQVQQHRRDRASQAVTQRAVYSEVSVCHMLLPPAVFCLFTLFLSLVCSLRRTGDSTVHRNYTLHSLRCELITGYPCNPQLVNHTIMYIDTNYNVASN